MVLPVRTLRGIVLNREESGEGYLRLKVFSPDEGLVLVFKRTATKRSPGPLPDFFDELEVHLRRPRSGGDSISFVEEWRALRRRPELASGRDRLEVASSIAGLYLKNGSHLAEPAPAANLLSTALDSLCEGFDPFIVHLKILYSFARAEGYPVKEDWWQSLPNQEKTLAAKALNVPLSELVKDIDGITALLESLRVWINEETEMRC